VLLFYIPQPLFDSTSMKSGALFPSS
jgi:hypothetical protein